MDDNSYAAKVKQALKDCIGKLDSVKEMFLLHPGRDFTRRRVIPFDVFINICLQMEGCNLQGELLNYFEHSDKTPYKSAFCQQRAKVLPDALKFLFRLFTEILMDLDTPKTFKGFRLLACDGSDINIPYNLEDPETYHQNADKKGYNQLHLNALFDVLNGIYIDCVLEPDRKSHERAAFITMVDRMSSETPSIIMADRGYESYNIFAHLYNSGQKFLIRLKDDESNGILSTWDFQSGRDTNGEFDCNLETILTCKQTNEVKANWVKYTYCAKNKFDFYEEDTPFYNLKLRIVCIEVAPGVLEYLATNLDRFEFPPAVLKELYHLRWNEETSFRNLKYTIDLSHFHCKKRAFVEQEAWAKLIVYNFCAAITWHMEIPAESTSHKRKHEQKINFATAASICRAMLKHIDGKINLCRLIAKFLIPIRPDRSAPRNLKPKSAKSFLYRAAKA